MSDDASTKEATFTITQSDVHKIERVYRLRQALEELGNAITDLQDGDMEPENAYTVGNSIVTIGMLFSAHSGYVPPDDDVTLLDDDPDLFDEMMEDES